MTTVSGKNLYAERLLNKNNELAKEYPMDMSRLKIKYQEEKPKKILSYYDSIVKNSMLYPNMMYIRPYELDYLAVSNGKIQKEAFDNETFQIGGLTLKRSQLPKARNMVF
jgi:hypothetical protein